MFMWTKKTGCPKLDKVGVNCQTPSDRPKNSTVRRAPGVRLMKDFLSGIEHLSA